MRNLMFGKNFLYILFREGGICHKMGVSSDICRRINDLNRQFGPFCPNRSLVLRTDSKNEAYMLETLLKCSYSAYNTPLPEKLYTDGETEWFAEECYDDMCSSLALFAKQRMGDGYDISPVDPQIFKPLTENSVSKQYRFQRFLEGRRTQIKVLCENTKNAKNFRTAIMLMMPKLIGVVKLDSNEFSSAYEIFLSGDSSAELLDEIFRVSRLSADNDEIWAGANLCVSTESSSIYKKASFSIPHHGDPFEKSWESKGKLLTYTSMLEDLAVAFPMPPAYQQHVGRSFLDDLSLDELTFYRSAIWEALFSHASDNDVKNGSKASCNTKSTKSATTKALNGDPPSEKPSAQLSFDFLSHG
ncbi:GIY-YIG nuclease family protein [Pseudomonas aeruginosa]|uniref:GIY-YIG nuclease family protein n=1 Tax=Pseudomonas aeruginosa TaxID=287 RepID=UPI00385400FD